MNIKAIKAYDKAIGICPDLYNAFNHKGFILFENKRFRESLDCFDKAIFLKEDFSEAFNNKELVFWEMGDYYQAIFFFDKALGVSLDNFSAFRNKVKLLRFLREKICFLIGKGDKRSVGKLIRESKLGFYHVKCGISFLHFHYLMRKEDFDIKYLIDNNIKKNLCVFNWKPLYYNFWVNRHKNMKYLKIFYIN